MTLKKKYENVCKMNRLYKITLSIILILILFGIASAATVIDSTSITGLTDLTSSNIDVNYIDGVIDITSDDSDLNPLSPIYQISPFNSSWSTAGNYSVNGTGANFHLLSWVKNYGTQPTVAVFGEGIAERSYSTAWGGNFVAYANSSGATAVGTEINYGSMASGGVAYGALIISAGDYSTSNGLRFQSNTVASRPTTAIYFNSETPLGGSDIQPATNALLGTSSNLTVPYGLDFTSATFSASAIGLGNDQGITAMNNSSMITDIINFDSSNILWLGSGTPGSISQVIIPEASGSLRIQSLAGSGNAFLCVDSEGNVYRNATACVP